MDIIMIKKMKRNKPINDFHSYIMHIKWLKIILTRHACIQGVTLEINGFTFQTRDVHIYPVPFPPAVHSHSRFHSITNMIPEMFTDRIGSDRIGSTRVKILANYGGRKIYKFIFNLLKIKLSYFVYYAYFSSNTSL